MAVLCLQGSGRSLFQVARQSLIAARVPNELRGTASSSIGGAMRVAGVAGPLVGGAIVEAFNVAAAFWVQAALLAAAAL
eukprot:3761456-Prymnesium_polylepis.1